MSEKNFGRLQCLRVANYVEELVKSRLLHREHPLFYSDVFKLIDISNIWIRDCMPWSTRKDLNHIWFIVDLLCNESSVFHDKYTFSGFVSSQLRPLCRFHFQFQFSRSQKSARNARKCSIKVVCL